MRPIDCHVQILPLNMVEEEVSNVILSSRSIKVEEYNGICRNPAELVRILDEAEVEKAGLISYQSPDVIGVKDEKIKFIAEYRSQFRDRLVPGGVGEPGRRR